MRKWKSNGWKIKARVVNILWSIGSEDYLLTIIDTWIRCQGLVRLFVFLINPCTQYALVAFCSNENCEWKDPPEMPNSWTWFHSLLASTLCPWTSVVRENVREISRCVREYSTNAWWSDRGSGHSAKSLSDLFDKRLNGRFPPLENKLLFILISVRGLY